MKVVYIAHPIGGDQERNMKKVAALIRYINMKWDDIVPAAPYMADLMAMRDEVPEERERGFRNNEIYFKRQLIDELWVCGKVSAGVATEIDWANKYKIPVVMATDIWIEIDEEFKEYEFGAPMFPEE